MFKDSLATFLGEWSVGTGAGAVLFKLALSILFSAVIGCERANKRHSAGLRTFIAVSMASTAAMLLDSCLISEGTLSFPLLSAASVISVAIICTNSILFSARSQIKGLTTAVALWACGILGLSLGAGLYTLGCVLFVALISCLSILPTLEAYLKNRSNHFEIHLELKDKHGLSEFLAVLRQLGLRIDDIEANPAYMNSGLGVFSICLTITREQLKKYKSHSEIITALSTISCVSFVEEIQ